ncbi:MAG: hypothetical protein WCW01_05730 [Gammaproteobacteria bacterium]
MPKHAQTPNRAFILTTASTVIWSAIKNGARNVVTSENIKVVLAQAAVNLGTEWAMERLSRSRTQVNPPPAPPPPPIVPPVVAQLPQAVPNPAQAQRMEQLETITQLQRQQIQAQQQHIQELEEENQRIQHPRSNTSANTRNQTIAQEIRTGSSSSSSTSAIFFVPKPTPFSNRTLFDLKNKLVEELGLNYSNDIRNGTMVEQLLVDMANIHSRQPQSYNQQNPSRYEQQPTIILHLQLTKNEYNQFMYYYNTKFPGFLSLSGCNFSERELSSVQMNTEIFKERVIPCLAEYKTHRLVQPNF